MEKHNMNEEVWKGVKGWEDRYQVSNCGRVKSLERVTVYKNGRKRKFPSKILNPGIESSGYRIAILQNGIKKKSVRVHRLVAEAFLDNPNNYPEVNHKDENKLNNHISNLEWMTFKENINYGTGIERRAKKGGKPIAKLDMEGNVLKVYSSVTEAEEVDGYNRSNTSNAAKGNLKQAYGYKWEYID